MCVNQDSQVVQGTSQGYFSLDWTGRRWHRTPGHTWYCQSDHLTLGRDPEGGGKGRK